MFSRATRLLIGTYSCPLKLGASFGRLREGTYCIIGLFYRREFSITSGINCESFMEDTQKSRAGTALAAVCQMNSTSDVDRNLGICEDLVRKAKSRGAKVCLHSTVWWEKVCTGQSLNDAGRGGWADAGHLVMIFVQIRRLWLKLINDLIFTSLFVFLCLIGRLKTKLKPNFYNVVQIKKALKIFWF